MDYKRLEPGKLKLENVFIGVNDNDVISENRHFHPYWELKVYMVDEQVHLVMTPPGKVHGNTPYTELRSGWTLHCREPMLNLSFFSGAKLSEDYFFPWDEVDKLCPGGLTGMIQSIVRAKEQNADERLFNALLETFWAVICRVWTDWRDRPARTSSLTDMAKYYIEHNYYKSSLSVDSVATNLGVTAGHLANLFKQEKLPTLRQYIVKVRMDHALRLLRSRRYTVKEVADMTGWNCQFYFSNCFRKRFGVPPSQAPDLIEDDSFVTN